MISAVIGSLARVGEALRGVRLCQRPAPKVMAPWLDCLMLGSSLVAWPLLAPAEDSLAGATNQVLAFLRPQVGDQTQLPGPSETAPVPPLPREWFGQELPWRKWTHLTGDWHDGRRRLEELGLALDGDYTLDWSTVFAPDLPQKAIARGLLDFHLTLDPKPLLGMEDGKLFAQYFYRHGPNASDITGDIQGFSNLDAKRLSQLEELWYEQYLFQRRMRLKVGQVDANAEFACIEAAGEFLNSSAGYSPTILDLPTYPNPRLSLNVFVYPAAWLYAGAGIYGESIFQGAGFNHPFGIGEIGITHPATGKWGAGRLGLGAWHHAQDYDCYANGQRKNASGCYAVAEQHIWRKNPLRREDTSGASLLAQYGWGDENVSAVVHHASLGIVVTGLISGRDQDTTGIRWSWARLSRVPGAGFDRDETSAEWFYRIHLTPFFSLQPDLQWLCHPGGKGGRDDALVGTLRWTITF